VRSDRPTHLAGDGAVAALGERRNRLGEVGRDTRRDRHLALSVCGVCVAHTLIFGYARNAAGAGTIWGGCVSLLNARFSLHDVDDVERFVSGIIQRSRLQLSYHQTEDLTSFLVASCWELSIRYEPNGRPFSSWAGQNLHYRAVDWTRKEFGRTRWQSGESIYERSRPELVSLDTDDPIDGGVGSALSAGGVDDGTHRLADELRNLEARARRPSRRDGWLG
jgi:hypothetical protein